MPEKKSYFSELFSRIAEFIKNMIEKIREIGKDVRREGITIPILRFGRDNDSEMKLSPSEIEKKIQEKEEKEREEAEKQKGKTDIEKENPEPETDNKGEHEPEELADDIVETENGTMVRMSDGKLWPIAEVRDMLAMQQGYDDYADLRANGGSLGKYDDVLIAYGHSKTEDGTIVHTNKGDMQLEEFQEEIAHQEGFENYQELCESGYKIVGLDIDEKEEKLSIEEVKEVGGFFMHLDNESDIVFSCNDATENIFISVISQDKNEIIGVYSESEFNKAIEFTIAEIEKYGCEKDDKVHEIDDATKEIVDILIKEYNPEMTTEEQVKSSDVADKKIETQAKEIEQLILKAIHENDKSILPKELDFKIIDENISEVYYINDGQEKFIGNYYPNISKDGIYGIEKLTNILKEKGELTPRESEPTVTIENKNSFAQYGKTAEEIVYKMEKVIIEAIEKEDASLLPEGFSMECKDGICVNLCYDHDSKWKGEFIKGYGSQITYIENLIPVVEKMMLEKDEPVINDAESLKTPESPKLTPELLKLAIDTEDHSHLPEGISFIESQMPGTNYVSIYYNDNFIADYFPTESPDSEFNTYNENSIKDVLDSLNNGAFETTKENIIAANDQPEL